VETPDSPFAQRERNEIRSRRSCWYRVIAHTPPSAHWLRQRSSGATRPGEVRLKQGGLLQEALALLSGVEPVGSGARQVEDASPAMERAVEQVQDGPGVIGDVDLPHASGNAQALSDQTTMTLIDS